MWRYGIGVEPERKRPKTNEEKAIRDREYESDRRVRKFNQQWLDQFGWLQFERDQNTMFCMECKASPLADKQSAFVVGSKNFKIDPIKAHGQSTCHTRVMQKKKAEREEPGTSQASKALSSLQKSQQERLNHLFRTTHAIVKNARPFTDFVWHCQLDIMKKVDIGQAYHNDKGCKEMTRFISKASLQQLVHDIHEATCYSVICDESTDSSALEELIIYVMFAVKGKVSVKFLCLTPLNKPDASSVYLAIKEACTLLLQFTPPFKKLVCFAADGAATMQGKKTGVGQRITEDQPGLIKLHCMAHRLELAFKTTVKGFDEYRKVEDFLLRLYLFYHNSPSNRAQLKEACITLACKFLVPTRVGGTRWLPHMERAFRNLWAIFEAVLVQLENCSIAASKTESASNASGLLKLMKSKPFMHRALELNSVISCLQNVSLVLQTQVTTLFQAQNTISSAMESLEDLKNDGTIEEKLKSMPIFKNSLQDTLGRNRNSTTGIYEKFLEKMVEQMKIRFPDENPKLVSCSRLLSLNEWPEHHSTDFGKKEVKELVTAYDGLLQSINVNTDCVYVEWISLKKCIYACHKNLRKLSWEVINTQNHFGHANILGLFDFLLSLPCTSADCERGFSTMKGVKTDWRSKLGADTLTDLMRVKLNTPGIGEFNPIPSVALWLEGSRRLETKPYGKREMNCESDISSSDEGL